jgi:hypothetical protein
VFENRVPRKILRSKRDEVTGGWTELHSEELHNLYSSPGIMRMAKSRRVRWKGLVERIGIRGMHINNGEKARRNESTRYTKT